MSRNDPVAASLIAGRFTIWHPLVEYWRAWTTVVMSTAVLWLERGRSRRVLATLDDHQLSDIGTTREEARIESAKPFWQA